MANTNLLIIGVLLIGAVMSYRNRDWCFKSFPSGATGAEDELMTALYVADPNPETGYLNITHQDNSLTCELVNNSLSYESWLTQGEHDAKKELINLWSYLTRLVVSDVFETYCHYKIVFEQGDRKPRGIINFDTIKDSFKKVIDKWETDSHKWPYGCLKYGFFLNTYFALIDLRSFGRDDYYFKGVELVYRPAVRPYSYIQSMSTVGMEGYLPADILDRLFEPVVLQYIPESAQDNVFYQSRLMWESLERLMKGKSSFNDYLNSWKANYIEKTLCSQWSGKPVAVKYYCKQKAYAEKLQNCSKLSDVTPCVYDKEFQDYFVRGRFVKFDELNVLEDIFAKTQTVLTEFKNKAVAKDRNGLNSLYNKHKPYITVEDSMCHLDWPKAFNCTDNIECHSRNKHKFDCNGGYTCRINTMFRFDCLLKFVLNKTKQLLDASASGNWESSEVLKAKNDLLIWLSYLPMARYARFTAEEINSVILYTQGKANEYVTSYDTDGFKTFVSNLPLMSFVPQWAKDAACQQVSIPFEYTIFCNLDPLLNSVFLFINAFEHSKNSTTKTLNPTVDYVTLLGQLQLDRAASLISSQTQQISNQFRYEVQQNFEELSSYFSSLADYDKTKANANIGYIDGRLTLFKNKIASISRSVARKFDVILEQAILINVAELIGQAVRVGVAVAQVANPLSTVLGGSSILDLIDAINSLAQAGVTTAVIARLGDREFEDLTKQAIELGTKFAENEAQLKDAKTFIDKIKKGEDAVGIANDFLGKYNAYTPKVLLPDITSYGAKWETVAEDLCQAAFSSETSVAAMLEIGLASTGDCVNIKVEIQELITYYKEFYDYQFDLMDSLSDAARAYLAYKKAKDLTSAYTHKQRLATGFMKKTAVNALIVSTLNVWEIVTEYCDALTYTRGGEVPHKCETALRTPSHHAVAQVMSYKPETPCHANNEITHYQNIPTKPTGATDKAYIDLKALYARETVTFKIPSFQWLKDNGWFGYYDPEKAVYIKRFEIFLPPMSGKDEHLIEVEAQPGMANYLRYGGTKYLLPVTGYTTRYTENGYNCYNTIINNPYALCRVDDLVRLCITSNGYVNRAIQPSIYNEWNIKVNSLPPNKTAPQPVTNFKIQAGITMCVVNLSPSANKREIPKLSSILKRKTVDRTRRDEHHCCASNQYWTGSQCSICPSGSSQQLHGFYCQ